jgi:hypothetical protein
MKKSIYHASLEHKNGFESAILHRMHWQAKGVSQSNSCYYWPDDLIGSSGLLLVILTPCMG